MSRIQNPPTPSPASPSPSGGGSGGMPPIAELTEGLDSLLGE